MAFEDGGSGGVVVVGLWCRLFFILFNIFGLPYLDERKKRERERERKKIKYIINNCSFENNKYEIKLT